MAGSNVHHNYEDRGAVQVSLLAPEGVTAITAGAWFRVQKQRPITVTIEGDFVGTVQVYGSNATSQPPVDTNRPPVGPGFNAPGSFIVDGSFEWMRADVSAYTSGTAYVFMVIGG